MQYHLHTNNAVYNLTWNDFYILNFNISIIILPLTEFIKIVAKEKQKNCKKCKVSIQNCLFKLNNRMSTYAHLIVSLEAIQPNSLLQHFEVMSLVSLLIICNRTRITNLRTSRIRIRASRWWSHSWCR